MGFSPKNGGSNNGTLVATGSSTIDRAISFPSDSTKKRLVKWMNINLGIPEVTGTIRVKRTNANGTASYTAEVPLAMYQTSADFQANKVTFNTEIFLDDSDEIILSLTKSNASDANVTYTLNYSLV